MFELELSWVGEVSGGMHQYVPESVFAEAEQYAKVWNTYLPFPHLLPSCFRTLSRTPTQKTKWEIKDNDFALVFTQLHLGFYHTNNQR